MKLQYKPADLSDSEKNSFLIEEVYGELEQAIGNRVGQVAQPVCKWMRCKDYLNEVIVCNLLPKSVFNHPIKKLGYKKGERCAYIYGFPYNAERNPLRMDECVMFQRWKHNRPKDFAKRQRHIVRQLNKYQPKKWKKMKVYETDRPDILVVTASKNYLQTTFISLLSLCLRMPEEASWPKMYDINLYDYNKLYAYSSGANKGILSVLKKSSDSLGMPWLKFYFRNHHLIYPGTSDSLEEAMGIDPSNHKNKWYGKITENYHNYAGLQNTLQYVTAEPDSFTVKNYPGPLIWGNKLREVARG